LQRACLIAALRQLLLVWNQKPKPLVWTVTVQSILAKLARCRQTLEQVKPAALYHRNVNARKVQLILKHYTSSFHAIPVARTIPSINLIPIGKAQ
jgi:hypothetical protein